MVASRKAVIVLSSHVVRGSVGNRAAVFALETLGFPVWAMPTIVLPWHPGHGKATRIVPDPQQFADLLGDLENAPWLDEVGAVLSGYLGDSSQAEAVASLVNAVKRQNNKACYLCDPVIGDQQTLYVTEATARAIKDQLLPLADIATPNRFELEWLTGRPLVDIQQLRAAASECGPKTMLVTSCHGSDAGQTGNLLCSTGRALLAEHSSVERPPNGPGDLTAAVLLAHLMSGETVDEALRATTASVFEILSHSARSGADELPLESQALSLSHPSVAINVRELSPAEPAAVK